MMISFVVAVYFQFVHRALGLAPLTPTRQLVIGVAITTVGWLAVTFATPPTDRATLQMFYDRIRPMGPGWNGAVKTRPANEIGRASCRERGWRAWGADGSNKQILSA